MEISIDKNISESVYFHYYSYYVGCYVRRMGSIDMVLARKYYTFGEIINIVKDAYLSYGESSFYTDNDWCVYSDNNVVELDTKCYIDVMPDINDKYEEVYPEFVRDNGLALLYRCDILQDAVSSAIEQKAEITDEELFQAIKYYDENDDFIDFHDVDN